MYIKQVVDNNRNSTDNLRNTFIIKNLEYNEREKNESVLTKNKVQGLLRDGLGLANVQIKSASRSTSYVCLGISRLPANV
jgi:16S rRNA C1402 N4-methylase RsmH